MNSCHFQIKDGKKIEEIETHKILEHAEDPYTKKLLHAQNREVNLSTKKWGKDTILQVKDLCCGYGKKNQIIKGQDLELYKGTTLAIVGESGSGKSTLAKALSGLLYDVSGDIVFDGSTMHNYFAKRTKEELRKMQIIHQIPDTALNSKRKVKDVIGRPLKKIMKLHGTQKREKIKELLNDVGLDSKVGDRYVFDLSGGQKQRVSIAQALAARPEVIICDEITSALDVIVGNKILQLNCFLAIIIEDKAIAREVNLFVQYLIEEK